MCVTLGIQHAMHIRRIVIFGLHGSPIYFAHYLINGMIFEKKLIEVELCVLIFSTAFVWKIFCSKRNLVRYDQKYVLVFM